tara:strand:- start:1555 stop:2661 length:1107 start_codon:yes stop_codon:yes gene_type:complete
MLLLIIFFLIIIFILPSLILLFIFIYKKDNLKNFVNITFYNHEKTYFSNSKNNNYLDRLVFLPHPILNWSLNPNYKNIYGEIVHTKEGFRKTLSHDSIIDYLDNHPNTFKIICIGGSSTHCLEMDKFEDTWPALVQQKLKNENCIVINFGVGAWTTMQSLIRCITWFPKIKPDLLIFYHAKNDLTPLVNGNLDEKFIYPDYQNVMTQFTERYISGLPKYFFYIPLIFLLYYFFDFKKNRLGLLGIYKPYAEENELGMKRLDTQFFNSIIFRQQTIIDICKKNNCDVIYIPEIVREGVYKETLESKIYPAMKNIVNNYDNCDWFEVKDLIPDSSDYFLDKMHFSLEGNKLFSTIIANKIIAIKSIKKEL